MVSARRIAFNLLTMIPGVDRLPVINRRRHRRYLGEGGTDKARYCYTVWLRHLVLAQQNGLNVTPQVIAELGPGNSIGMGLAALLCGAEKYYAFDVVAQTNVQRNLAVFEELIALFRARAPIPSSDEFARVRPTLSDYAFPAHILTPERMREAMSEERLQKIRWSIEHVSEAGSMIKYQAPWFDAGVVQEGTVDVIFSQAVLEHVDDLDGTYSAMRQWLKPDGYISHEIDLSCHGWAREWNGHLTYSDMAWKIIRGKDLWLINRETKSAHIRLLERTGFQVVGSQTARRESRVRKDQVARRYRGIPEDDLTATGYFVQATVGTRPH